MLGKEYVKKISVKGEVCNYSAIPKVMNIKMKMLDGTEVKLNTTGKMTIGQIVNGLIVKLQKAKRGEKC